MGGGALPEGFLVGVATSGFQIEGGYNGPGEPVNNWHWWELTGRVEPSGVACDFWRSPEPALERAARLGCNAFRLSIEWTRLEPQEGEVDSGALDRYLDILKMCGQLGMAPVVTLHHFTHPAWLGEEFWLTPGAPDRFAAHVARILPALTAHCRHWVTVNEPNIVALMGWMEGSCPPGRKGAAADAWAVVDNLLTAHVLAYEAIHAEQRDALVTMNTSASSIYDYDRILTDLLCARSMGIQRQELDEWVDERRAVHNALFPARRLGEYALRSLFATVSPYGGVHRGRRPASDRTTTKLAGGRLRLPCPRRVVAAVYDGAHDRPLDASGFDWYDPVAVHALRVPGHRSSGGRRWEAGRALWDIVANPRGLGAWCKDQHALVPDIPVWVVENGMASLVRNGRSYPRVDGWDRRRYLREHLAAIVAALDADVPVRAYLHWSLVDNYEWGSYEPRFGIFGMDRSRGERGVRWLDTDAAGVDTPGTFKDVVGALMAGDRTVLDAGAA